MLDFIRDAVAFLASATPTQAQDDCDLTRSALGLHSSGTQPEREVQLLSEWLESHDWWRDRAEDAVRHHCSECPAQGCPVRNVFASPLMFV